jgi:hypothetical protein
MKGYLISTADRPGLTARLMEAAAARGVNVFPAFGLADGTTGMLLLGSDDEVGLGSAIADCGLVATAFEMAETELENVPGAGATLFRKLANAGIDLRIAVPIGMDGDKVQLALGATDPERLKAALAG